MISRNHSIVTGLLAILFLGSSLLTAAEPNTLSEAEKKAGWQLLFDGKTTKGWRNYQAKDVSDGWKIVDGALTRAGKGAGAGADDGQRTQPGQAGFGKGRRHCAGLAVEAEGHQVFGQEDQPSATPCGGVSAQARVGLDPRLRQVDAVTVRSGAHLNDGRRRRHQADAEGAGHVRVSVAAKRQGRRCAAGGHVLREASKLSTSRETQRRR